MMMMMKMKMMTMTNLPDVQKNWVLPRNPFTQLYSDSVSKETRSMQRFLVKIIFIIAIIVYLMMLRIYPILIKIFIVIIIFIIKRPLPAVVSCVEPIPLSVPDLVMKRKMIMVLMFMMTTLMMMIIVAIVAEIVMMVMVETSGRALSIQLK